MIQANELRIGNLIEANGPIMEVKAINGSNVELYLHGSEADNWDEELEKCSGIPLTPELLGKIEGFDYMKNYDWYIIKYNRENELKGEGYIQISYQQSLDSWVVSIARKKYIVCINTLEHIHQLQNLYYALTGSELSINL